MCNIYEQILVIFIFAMLFLYFYVYVHSFSSAYPIKGHREAGACLSTRGSVHPHQSVTRLTQRNRQPFTLIFKLTANWDSPISPHVTSVSACLHDSDPKPSCCEATVRYMLFLCIYTHSAYTYNSIIQPLLHYYEPGNIFSFRFTLSGVASGVLCYWCTS